MHLEMHASLKRRWVIHQKDSAYKEVCTQYKTASITGCFILLQTHYNKSVSKYYLLQLFNARDQSIFHINNTVAA